MRKCVCLRDTGVLLWFLNIEGADRDRLLRTCREDIRYEGKSLPCQPAQVDNEKKIAARIQRAPGRARAAEVEGMDKEG